MFEVGCNMAHKWSVGEVTLILEDSTWIDGRFWKPGLLISELFFLVGTSKCEASLRPGVITAGSSCKGNILGIDCGTMVLHNTIS